MRKIETSFEGLYVLETIHFQDERGGFQKLFNDDFFKENGLDKYFRIHPVRLIESKEQDI